MRLTAASPQERTGRCAPCPGPASTPEPIDSAGRPWLGLGGVPLPHHSQPASTTVTVIATTAEPVLAAGKGDGLRQAVGFPPPGPGGDSLHPSTAPRRPKRRRAGSAANREPDGSAHAAGCMGRGSASSRPRPCQRSTRHRHRPGILGCAHGAPASSAFPGAADAQSALPARQRSAACGQATCPFGLITAETPCRFAHSDRLQ